MFNNPPQIVYLWDNVKKYCTARQATGDSMVCMHCMLDT